MRLLEMEALDLKTSTLGVTNIIFSISRGSLLIIHLLGLDRTFSKTKIAEVP